MKGILDTSVFIAAEQARPLTLEMIPDQAAVSIVTVAELELGVHLAVSEEIRARRMTTLGVVQAIFVAVPIDGRVASAFAELVATARRAGLRPKVQDTWIAATAKAHSAALYTQDRGFAGLPGVDVVYV